MKVSRPPSISVVGILFFVIGTSLAVRSIGQFVVVPGLYTFLMLVNSLLGLYLGPVEYETVEHPAVSRCMGIYRRPDFPHSRRHVDHQLVAFTLCLPPGNDLCCGRVAS